MLKASMKASLLASIIAAVFIPCGHSGAQDKPLRVAVAAARDSSSVNGLNRERLIAAARAGGDYLARMQRPDGSFYYSYDAERDRVNSRAYNIVRHAGTAYSLFQLYAATRDARYLDAARRAVSYLKARFRPAREKKTLYVIDNDGKAKLGANGLALVALAKQIELDPKSADRDSAAQLANQILAMQNRDGSFESYYIILGDEPRGSVSLYYPGEAILGLAQLYRLNGDRRLLESARRGVDYLIESQRKMKQLPPDAWLTEALEAMYRIKPERKYAEHAMALAEAMAADQYGENSPAGYAGGFGPGAPRATPAASRAEGLVSAYRLARDINDPRASKIASSLKLAAQFQLSQQFDFRSSASLPSPERASGGFRDGMSSWHVRIDYVQHNISSLLGIAETLY